jgi:hypothetical protein
MSALAWALLGAIGVSILWMFVLAWLLDVLAAQRRALTQASSSVRLYRAQRDDSDTQIRALLSQNERLAIQLIEQAAQVTPGVVQVPATFFQAGRES